MKYKARTVKMPKKLKMHTEVGPVENINQRDIHSTSFT